MDFYRFFFSCWPQSVRVPLRAAIKAERKGDRQEADRQYVRAEEAALAASSITSGQKRLADDQSDLLHKLTGIAIARAANLEAMGRTGDAFEVYAKAFDVADALHAADSADPAGPFLMGKDRMRRVVMAQKLGDLASSGQIALVSTQPLEQDDQPSSLARKLDAVAEKYYAFSIEEMLRLVLPAEVRAARIQGQPEPSQDSPGSPALPAPASPLDDLELPEWVTTTDLGASLEALGGYYLARRQPVKAVPLYHHALSLLMPSESSVRRPEAGLTVAERCHAGILFFNLASALTDAAALPVRAAAGTDDEAKGQLEYAAAQGQQAAAQGLRLVQTTQSLAGFPSTHVESDAPIGAVVDEGPKTVTVLHTSSERTLQVQDECKLAEACLMYAIGRATARSDRTLSARWLRTARRAASPLVAPSTSTSSPSGPRQVDPDTRMSASELLRALHDELGPSRS